MDQYIIGGRREDIISVAQQDSPLVDLRQLHERDLLKNIRVKELYPPNKPKIIVVEKQDSVPKVFKLLIENNILSVPVMDLNKGICVGLVDSLDLVCYIIDVISEADVASFSTLLQSSEQLQGKTCGGIIDASGRNPYYPVEENAPLLAAIEIMVAQRLHRIPVINATGQLISIVTQSHVVALINKHLVRFSVREKTVQELNLGLKEVLTIKASDQTIEAFKMIHHQRVSGIGVVDDQGVLLGNISSSDLKNIGSQGQKINRLFLSIDQYLKLVNDDIKIHCVRTSDSFATVLDRLVHTASHRIYVIDAEGKPIGVISLIDVLQCILENSK